MLASVMPHSGLDISAADMAALLSVDLKIWAAEAEAIEQHYAKFGARLPAALAVRLQDLKTATAAG